MRAVLDVQPYTSYAHEPSFVLALDMKLVAAVSVQPF